MKRKKLVIGVFALLLIACAVITPAVAYFTANAEADGAIPISFQYRTEIEDYVVDWLKSVRIHNEKYPVPGDTEILSDPIWVRARAFSGETYPLIETPEDGNWVKQGDWWYYQLPVPAGGYTSYLTFDVTGYPAEDAEDVNFTTINVGVVYETTLVRYDEDGNILPANWDIILQSVTEEGY